jgi:hypothetical protein
MWRHWGEGGGRPVSQGGWVQHLLKWQLVQGTMPKTIISLLFCSQCFAVSYRLPAESTPVITLHTLPYSRSAVLTRLTPLGPSVSCSYPVLSDWMFTYLHATTVYNSLWKTETVTGSESRPGYVLSSDFLRFSSVSLHRCRGNTIKQVT